VTYRDLGARYVTGFLDPRARIQRASRLIIQLCQHQPESIVSGC
jgi:hypothetical protein